ncbi:MAG: hypothetical protein QM737_23315 [Ferruginibacter sp.]
MLTISDEYMQAMLATIKPYCIVLLRSKADPQVENIKSIIWEHGRRNFALRAEGKICIVSPVSKEADVAGLYIFNTSEEETISIMKEDPAVIAGIFDFDVYPCMSFPGDSLK